MAVQYEITRTNDPCCWCVTSRSAHGAPQEMHVASDDSMLAFVRGIVAGCEARIQISCPEEEHAHYPLRAIA